MRDALHECLEATETNIELCRNQPDHLVTGRVMLAAFKYLRVVILAIINLHDRLEALEKRGMH